MARMHTYLFLPVIILLAVLASGCGPLLTPVRVEGQAPTPVVQLETGATDDPNVFVEREPFQATLLQAIQARDEARLTRLMAETFFSGQWRGEMGDLPRADALRALYRDQLGQKIDLNPAASSELQALMGGLDPLALAPSAANVVDLIFVTGWGVDGRDEAILFVARQPDRSLRWAGTLVIPGGFTSPETGGVQPYANTRLGFQMYLPKGYEVQDSSLRGISILAPQSTAGERMRASITIQPAQGRSVEQIVAELKTTALSDVAEQPGTVIHLDEETAMVFDRVPSQYMMRMLYAVHEDRLYQMIFLPQDEAEGEAYQQMLDLYAVITNTFQFIPIKAAPTQTGGKLVAEPAVLFQLLQQGLEQRDPQALRSMMGEYFTLTTWGLDGMRTILTPDEAVERILNEHLSAQPRLAFDPQHPVIVNFFSDPLSTDDGEALIPVHVSGWGPRGTDEAVLFIARRANGSVYWQGALVAAGGFE